MLCLCFNLHLYQFQGNYAKFLKNLHAEQTAKLSAKNQHECDLLEDIRTFTLKRSAIEKSYSEVNIFKLMLRVERYRLIMFSGYIKNFFVVSQ